MNIEAKTYLVYNHTTSPVAVGLRDHSFIIDAGSDDNPTTYPLTLAEIQHVNNTSTLFKSGVLRPSEEESEFIYNNLRITDWQNILTNTDIEDIILNPTAEKLKKIVNIKNALYFERIYGVYIGLKNADAPITANVMRVITTRYNEFLNNKRDSEITISEKTATPKVSEKEEAMTNEIEDLKARLKEMETLLFKTVDTATNTPKSVSDSTKTSTSPYKRKQSTKKTEK